LSQKKFRGSTSRKGGFLGVLYDKLAKPELLIDFGFQNSVCKIKCELVLLNVLVLKYVMKLVWKNKH
jgi:hypothetical protein